jgi:hypothetical protein
MAKNDQLSQLKERFSEEFYGTRPADQEGLALFYLESAYSLGLGHGREEVAEPATQRLPEDRQGRQPLK